MVTFPNAKVNLGLHVERKRPDGYHDISTIMLPVKWCDILEIIPARRGNRNNPLTVTGNKVKCNDNDNLVVKALKCVEQEIGRPLDVEIFLRKNIPDGAGLGGGSSDAAFTIKTLNELFDLGIEEGRQIEIARKLGADCPFFIHNRPLLATGIGDVFTPVEVPLSRRHIIIVKPQEKISTAQAYASIKPENAPIALANAVKAPVGEWKNIIRNDFEKVAFALFPSLQEIKRQLYIHGAEYASMSGSGSAFFGIFPHDYDKLTAAADFFINNGCRVHLSQLNF